MKPLVHLFDVMISKHWFQSRDFSCYTHQWPLKSCYLQQHGGQTNILFSSLMAITGRSNFLISEKMAIMLCFTLLSFVLHKNSTVMHIAGLLFQRGPSNIPLRKNNNNQSTQITSGSCEELYIRTDPTMINPHRLSLLNVMSRVCSV